MVTLPGETISRMSVSDMKQLIVDIQRQMPSLTMLNNDCLRRIILCLDNTDRLSLILALCKPNRRSYAALLRRSMELELRQIAVLEVAIHNVRAHVERLAERLFYLVPSCWPVSFVVTLDWSPFGNRASDASAAYVYWSEAAPHRRVIFHSKALRAHLLGLIGAHVGMTRVAFHMVNSAVDQRQAQSEVIVRMDGIPIIMHATPFLVEAVDAMLPLNDLPHPGMMMRSMPFLAQRRCVQGRPRSVLSSARPT